jgi:hypothetical protein
MKQKLNFAVLGLAVAGFSPFAQAINNAPADADTVTVRMSCNEGGTDIPNCFTNTETSTGKVTAMAALNTWLKTIRFAGPGKPTVVDIGPGTFTNWECSSSDVTLRGSGRDRTFVGNSQGSSPTSVGIVISTGCTNLNVQDMTVGGNNSVYGVRVGNLGATTSWTNVNIIGKAYAWVEFSGVDNGSACTDSDKKGKHLWFSSKITAMGLGGGGEGTSRAYTALCAQSWFWGSEITVIANNLADAFALEAHNAEVHLYGSNARLLLGPGTEASPDGRPHYLMAALNDSEIHIHGTGLDVIHDGAGTADMLYADTSSHFHATASGFNIHVSDAGKVQRLAGPGRIEAPYTWGESTAAPLSATLNGVGSLISRNGADRYTETDCQPNGNCSSGGSFPHDMVYNTACTGLAANQGPWYDMTTKACRQ